METVLITGATGFLGTYLIQEFLPHYRVRALGRNRGKAREIEALGAEFCCGDLRDPDSCGAYFQQVDHVVHAGALSTVWGPWKDFYETNVAGTEHVARLCRQHRVKRLIFLSSPSIYSQRRDRLDIREEDVDPDNRLNDYIRSKIAAEQVLRAFPDLYSVILRPRGLIGRGDSSLVPRILEANQTIGIPLFNGGKNLVDITCVENVAYAARLAVETEGIQGEVFNITNAEPMEFKAILELLLEGCGITPKYLQLPLPLMYLAAGAIECVYKGLQLKREPRITRYTICTLGYSQTLNMEKAREKLGYTPRLSLRQGIMNYVQHR